MITENLKRYESLYAVPTRDSAAITMPTACRERFSQDYADKNLTTKDAIITLHREIKSIIDPNDEISSQIRECVARQGYAIVSGFPVDESKPDTPLKKVLDIPSGNSITEKTLVYLSSLLGMPHAYEQENSGRYIHNLYPVKGDEMVASGTGSEVDLEFHTEIAFDDNKPDYLLLTAVRSRTEQNVPTTLVNVPEVLAQLSEEEINLLQEKIYFVRAPYSFSGGDDIYYRRSLADFSKGGSYCFNFNRGVVHCGTPEAKSLFEKLRSLFNKYAFGVLLSPGYALIIDNNQMLHGRSLFKPVFDGKDRWLQRLYVKKIKEAV